MILTSLPTRAFNDFGNGHSDKSPRISSAAHRSNRQLSQRLLLPAAPGASIAIADCPCGQYLVSGVRLRPAVGRSSSWDRSTVDFSIPDVVAVISYSFEGILLTGLEEELAYGSQGQV